MGSPSKSKKRETQTASRIQRLVLLSFALLFLIVGAFLASTNFLDEQSNKMFSGILLKVGFVLAIAWVAAPQLEKMGWQKLRGSMLLGAILVIVLWAMRPRIGAAAGAILVASMLLATVIGWFRKAGKISS